MTTTTLESDSIAELRAEALRLNALADSMEIEALERDGRVWRLEADGYRADVGAIGMLVEQLERATGITRLRVSPDAGPDAVGRKWSSEQLRGEVDFDQHCLARVEKVAARPDGSSLWRETN